LEESFRSVIECIRGQWC